MITGKLNLAALTHVQMQVKGKDGNMVDGIFIPVAKNHIFKSEKGGLYFDIVAFPMKEPADYGDHIVKQSLPKDVREKMTEEEKNAQPIMGNLNTKGGAKSEANNNPEPNKVFDPQKDDLPF